jgi:hypothetical protein
MASTQFKITGILGNSATSDYLLKIKEAEDKLPGVLNCLQSNDFDKIKKLFESGRLNITNKNIDGFGNSALIIVIRNMSIYKEDCSIIQFLIDKGVDVNYPKLPASSALSISVYSQFFSIARILVENGAKINNNYSVLINHIPYNYVSSYKDRNYILNLISYNKNCKNIKPVKK